MKFKIDLKFWSLFLALFGGYAILFHLVFPVFFAAAAALAVIPTVLLGWQYGIKAGIAAGVFSAVLNTLLFNSVGMLGWAVIWQAGGGLGTLVTVLLGAGIGYAHELSERLRKQIEANRAAEDALRESEARLQAALAESPMGIYQTTTDGHILYANAALMAMLGYQEWSELQRVNARELFLEPSEREEWMRLVEAEGVVQGFVTRLRRKDGSEFWAVDNGRTVRGRDNQIAYYEGGLLDITDRVNAEQALRESREKYQQLFERMLDGFALHEIILDEAGAPVDYRFLEVNPAFEKITGLKAAEILGKTVREVIPGVEERWIEIYGRTALTGEHSRFEGGSQELGKEFQVLVFSPAPKQFVTIFTDVTERKRMEQVLSESQARYWGLFENSPVSLWEEDFSEARALLEQLRRDGVDDFRTYFDEHPEMVQTCMRLFRVLDVNRATLEMYDARTKEELLANLDQVFSVETLDVVKEELIAIADGKTVFESEGKNRAISGRLIDINLRWVMAPGYETTAKHVFVSVIDITERKEAEKRRQRLAAQSEALAELSRNFLGANLQPGKIFGFVAEKAAMLVGDACMLAYELDGKYKFAALCHVHPEAGRLLDRSAGGWGELMSSCKFNQAVAGGDIVMLDGIPDDCLAKPRYAGVRKYLEQVGIEHLMIVPLLENRKVIGALVMLRDRGSEPFSQDDRAFLQNLAYDAALMVLNSRLYEQVKRQAETDSLTGVLTRRYFMHKAEDEFRRSKREGRLLSLVMLDVDHFKKINDSYGHDVGDRILKSLIERFRGKLRGSDVIGRFGGDEFLILLPETDAENACRLAERLRESVEAAPIAVGEYNIRATISLGAACSGDHNGNLSTLLQAVDESMYLAKRDGRNRVRRGTVSAR